MFAFYDLDVAPVSFDVLQFIVSAQSAADGEPIHAVIVPGSGAGGFKADDHKPIDDAEREWRITRVLGAAFRLAGITYTIAPTRDFARAFVTPEAFPRGYTVDKPTKSYYWSRALRPAVAGFKPTFKASARAKQHVERIHGSGFVTVTLRKTHTESRNSSEDWFDIAAQLSAKHNVVVIPDTSQIGKNGYVKAAEFGALDLDIRLAMYEAASLNLSASGGPFCMAVFMGLPYLWWHEAAKPPMQGEGHFHAVPAFMQLMGFPVGSQWPGHGQPNRRIFWEPDTYDNVLRAVEAAGDMRAAA